VTRAGCAVPVDHRTSWRAFSHNAPDHEMVTTISWKIRVPRVIVLSFFDRLPKKEVKFTRHNVFERDKNTCQYCGVVFERTDLNLDHVLPRDRGVIVQVGSSLAYRGIPLQAAYCGAKHAIQGFHDSLRCELIHDRSNVRVTMVQMPAVNTPQFGWCENKLGHMPQPVPPIFQPEVIARAALHLARHPRREMWVGWSAAKAIVGQKFLGGLLDRPAGRGGWEAGR